jgi:hypothetical protein
MSFSCDSLASAFVFGLASRQLAFRHRKNLPHGAFEFLRRFFGCGRLGLWHGKNVSPIDRNRKFIVHHLNFERLRDFALGLNGWATQQNRFSSVAFDAFKIGKCGRHSSPDKKQGCQDCDEQKRIEQTERGVHVLILSSGVWN